MQKPSFKTNPTQQRNKQKLQYESKLQVCLHYEYLSNKVLIGLLDREQANQQNSRDKYQKVHLIICKELQVAEILTDFLQELYETDSRKIQLTFYFAQKLQKKVRVIQKRLEKDNSIKTFLINTSFEEQDLIELIHIDEKDTLYRNSCKKVSENSKLIQDLQMQEHFRYELQYCMLELIGVMMTVNIIHWKNIKEDRVKFDIFNRNFVGLNPELNDSITIQEQQLHQEKASNLTFLSPDQEMKLQLSITNQSQAQDKLELVEVCESFYQDLNIFQDQIHPSLLIQNAAPKEGYSLFNLFEFTILSKGREYLKQIFQTPLKCLNQIMYRQNSVTALFDLNSQCGSMFNNRPLYLEVQAKLKAFHDIESIIGSWKRERIFDVKSIKNLLRSIQIFCQIDDMLYDHFITLNQKSELKDSLLKIDKDILASVYTTILQGLDLSGTKLSIRKGIFEELDTIRDQYNSLDDQMSFKLQELKYDLQELPDFMQRVRMIMIPSAGYFVSISKCDQVYVRYLEQNMKQFRSMVNVIDEHDLINFMLEDDLNRLGWRFSFVTETDLYFQNQATRELDQTQGDLFSQIQEMEFYFLSVIQKEILDNASVLLKMNEFIIKLDAYISLLMSVLEFNLTKPNFVTDSKQIKIQDARNMLVEFKSQDFRKQDYNITDQKLTVICGQNGSGKSIYLKNLGSIIYLAQIGCYVPCDSATLPIFTKILTKFASNENYTNFQNSFFYQETTKMTHILNSCDQNSLLLIDEYARGTSHINGMSLLITLIECLSNLNFFKQIKNADKFVKNLPITLISTNLVEIFEQEQICKIKQTSNLKIIQIDNQNTQDQACDRQLLSLYQNTLRPIECAKETNLDGKIIKRAQFLEKCFNEKRKILSDLET
eukprot:403355869